MFYDPDTNKYPYPENTDGHYLVVKKDRGIVFDANYPYIDESKTFKRGRALVRFLLKTVVFPMARIKMGLKIEGKENLKKYAEVLYGGAVTCSNHVHMWDYIAVMKALYPIKPYVLSWAKNVNGENGRMIRYVGGIPIPENNFAATKAYLKAVCKMLGSGGVLHVCPEGSMWEYYAHVRPFKKGAAYIACKTDKPVIPMGFSFRKPSFLRRLFGQAATITLNIGEPLYRDKDLPFKAQVEDLTVRMHRAVCDLAGIAPNECIYPPVFNGQKRADK